jgi:protein-tyrosine phosphatase
MNDGSPARPRGRIDVHSHLLPGVDDGCATAEDSIRCARAMVAAGYSQLFCTPHVWPGQLDTTTASIVPRVAALQLILDEHSVPLRLHPGGELTLRVDLPTWPAERFVTYGMRDRFVLFDLWAERLPEFFEPCVKFLQSRGLTCILAHPERMRAVQDQPELADYFTSIGLQLQGNLQCFSDPHHSHTRRVAEQFLKERRYFLLGSDLHNPVSLPARLRGLENAIGLAGEAEIDRLTVQNPTTLLGPD